MYHSELISMRLSASLLQRLDAKRGPSSRGAYLRALIERDLRSGEPTFRGRTLEDVTLPEPPATIAAQESSVTEPHRHTRGRIIDKRKDSTGRFIPIYQCAGCGEEMP